MIAVEAERIAHRFATRSGLIREPARDDGFIHMECGWIGCNKRKKTRLAEPGGVFHWIVDAPITP